MKFYEKAIDNTARRLGIQISRINPNAIRLPVEATTADAELIASLRPFTMTSPERIWSLMNAVRYLQNQKVPGDFVECGVWRGGSVMAMAKTLLQMGESNRDLWLYDTFEGMTPPSSKDVEAVTGRTAEKLLESTPVSDGDNVWCVADLTDVQRNIASTDYPRNQTNFIKGDVAQTLQEQFPKEIALLRLDTDWYESTKVELEVLYPLLNVGGVCILDDYGHWQGARAAVDEYFNDLGHRPYMHPIDFSGRVFIKTAPQQ